MRTEGICLMDNVIDLTDQAAFLAERASGMSNLIQCGWVYERAIDFDGLQRFHHHFGRTLLVSRRIQRSPLPFGRHRWIAGGDLPQIEIAASARPRAEFDSWLREQATIPIDAEHGPGWHLAVLPFHDGGAGVSLVVSHCLIDGVGLCRALADAACGETASAGWPAAASRRRVRTVLADTRQSARDLPRIGGAIKTAARVARRARRERAGAPATVRVSANTGPDEQVALPAATIFVDLAEWDARAQSRGGTSNSLLAGFAATLAHRLGRVRPGDGAVTLAIPVNQRTHGDTRANAITDISVAVDPTTAPTDLRQIRNTIKQALIAQHENPDEKWALLPLAPLVPQWLAKRMASVATGSPTTVTSSNLGDIDPAANRPDGSDADYFSIRSTYARLSRNTLNRIGGVVALLSGRVNGRIFISVLRYQPGQPNTTDHLRDAISHALADFSLTATFESDLLTREGVNHV
jgi:diacylglycerol O-acyltransferase